MLDAYAINHRTGRTSRKFTTTAKDAPTKIRIVTSMVASKRSWGLINGSATKVTSDLATLCEPGFKISSDNNATTLASNTPTIRHFIPSCRHQLSPIAPGWISWANLVSDAHTARLLGSPGARRRGQLALPADEAAVFVPVMMAGERLKSEFSRQSPLEPINELD